MWKRVVTLSTLIVAFALTPAFAGYCSDPPSIKEHMTLLEKAAYSGVTYPERGYVPNGSRITMSLALPEDIRGKAQSISYRMYFAEAGVVKPLTNRSFATGEQDGTIQLSGALSLKMEDNRFSDKVDVLVVGCLVGEDGRDVDSDPAILGRDSVIVTTKLRGWIWVLGLGVIAFSFLMLFAIKKKSEGVASIGTGFLMVVMGFRNTVSLSHVQLLVFSVSVALTSGYVFGRTNQISDLGPDVLMLLGISATGAVAGAWGDAVKNRLNWGTYQWLKGHGAISTDPKKIGESLSFNQLFTTRGRFDMYRFQALLFTILVAPAFVFSAAYDLANAEIPQGMLAVLGLSQTAYIFGKMAGTPTLQDFEVSIEERRTRLEGDKPTRLTQKGLNDLIEEFEAAMGAAWADKKAASKSLVAIPDGISSGSDPDTGYESGLSLAREIVSNAVEEAREARRIAAGLDPSVRAAALKEADRAKIASANAQVALRVFKNVLYSDDASAAGKTISDARNEVLESLAAIKTLAASGSTP